MEQVLLIGNLYKAKSLSHKGTSQIRAEMHGKGPPAKSYDDSFVVDALEPALILALVACIGKLFDENVRLLLTNRASLQSQHLPVPLQEIEDMGCLVTIHIVSCFVDSNLFFQCRPLDQLDWTPWAGFQEVRLIVSGPVLREIDYRKNKGNDRVGKRARSASAMFRELAPEGQKVVHDSSPRVVLSVDPQHNYRPDLQGRLDYQERDDQLVGTVYQFSQDQQGADVRLLTHDTTPLLTARSLGLTAVSIPENWLLQPESTEAERELGALRSEIARLKKTEPSFSVRCVGHSDTELEDYHASFTWFEPLTDDQVDELLLRLKARFPLETDFGSREPAERTVKQQTSFNALRGVTKDAFTPATDEEIEKYREEAYPEWLDRCEQILRDHHQALQRQAPLPSFSFLTANVGTRPATDALITIEAQGQFEIQPPSSRKEDEERGGKENELDNRKAEELPRPPAAPRGQWQRLIGGRPGHAIRNIDALRRTFDRLANVGTGVRRTGDLWKPPVNFQPPSRDPNAFYYKPDRPSSPGSSFLLSCDQWRHEDGEKPFQGTIHLPFDQDKVEGALFFRIQANNLSKSVSEKIPVWIEITHVSAFASAQAMVENLLEGPTFWIESSLDGAHTHE